MVNQSRIVALTQRLIQTPSENPGGTEKAVAQIVKSELETCGFEVKTYEFEKDRTNVVGVLKGKGNSSEKVLVLTPHLDTVPAGTGWRHPPFAAEIADGKIYGLGAADCKCNIAMCLEVAHQIKEKNITLDYDMIIAATADEEAGSGLGLIPLLENQILTPTHAIVTDIGGFRISIVQKGVLEMKATVFGKKAHGAYPWSGENAIEAASKIIMDLKNYQFNVEPHPLLHPPTINVGIIKGGEGINIVPGECEFTIDVRYLPGMDADLVALKIREIIEMTTKKYRLETLNMQPFYEINRKNPLVTKFEAAIKKNGVTPKVEGSEGATVITFFQNHNILAISFGIGSNMAHQANEYVEIDALVDGANVLLDFLKMF